MRNSLRSVLRASAVVTTVALVGCGGSTTGKSTDTTTTTTTTAPPATAPTTSRAGVNAPPVTVAPPATTTPPAGTTTPGSTTPPTPPTTTTPTTGKAVLAQAFQNQITVIDMATGNKGATIPVGKGPSSVATNNGYAYVAGLMSQDVSVVDLLTNTVSYKMDATGAGITNLPLIGNTVDPVLKPLVRPTGVAVTPNGTKAFSANLINVTSYDLIGKKPLNSIFGLNLQFTSGGTSLTSLITTISTGLQAFLAQPLAALGQARVACTDKTAFVTNMVTGNVTVISATDDKVIRYTDVGNLPLGVACGGNKAYVACVLGNEIYVLDETTGLVKTKFAAGDIPVDVSASPKGDFIYVANFLGGDVTVIDTATDLPVNKLPAGISLLTVFNQLGIPVPAGTTSTGLGGALTAFLGGFLGTTPNPAGSTTGIGGLLGSAGTGGGIFSPSSILNGLLQAFFAFAGINQQSLNSLALPGIGVVGVAVAPDGKAVAVANLLFGLGIVDIATQTVNAPQLLTGAGLGADAVATSN